MAEYFQCKEGCAKCCPDGTKNTPLVPLTLDDISGLYSLNGHTPEQFVDSHVWWKLDEDGLSGYLWLPIFPTPCPYLNEQELCDIYQEEARPLACKTFPESYLIHPQLTVGHDFVRDCVYGFVLPPDRQRKVELLEDRRHGSTRETVAYFGDIEVDPRIPEEVETLIGKIPLISILQNMLKNRGRFSPATIKAIEESKERLDERVVRFLEEL